MYLECFKNFYLETMVSFDERKCRVAPNIISLFGTNKL